MSLHPQKTIQASVLALVGKKCRTCGELKCRTAPRVCTDCKVKNREYRKTEAWNTARSGRG